MSHPYGYKSEYMSPAGNLETEKNEEQRPTHNLLTLS